MPASNHHEKTPAVYVVAEKGHITETEQNAGIPNGDYNNLETNSSIYDQLLRKAESPESVLTNPVLEKVKTKFDTKLEGLKQYPTPCLWVQYMGMIDILRRYIKSERTGNLEMHLQTVKEMLPFLAAAGHNLYEKSAYLYLQHMDDLQDTHHDVHDQFVHGHHVERRSER